jgi:replicative DNA helicase
MHSHRPLSDEEAAPIIVRAARDRDPPDRSITDRLDERWSTILVLAVDSGEEGIREGIASIAVRDPKGAQSCQSALDCAIGAAGMVPEDPEGAPTANRFDLGIIGSANFGAQRYAREWAIKNVLAIGQPAIVGGPRKGMKTSLMVDLVLSIATATPFLGKFSAPRPRRTLFLSGESGEPTIQETVVRVMRAKGLTWADLERQVFWGFRLPQLDSPAQLEALADVIRENRIELVVIDPLYLCLLSGNSRLDAANLFDVGPLLKRVGDTCLEAGATPVLVHHLRKNRDDHNAPPELEDLAFAGVQEFARQWVMIGRRETYEPGSGEHRLWLGVGGSSGHSGLWAVDVSEGIMDDDFSGRIWRVDVNAAADVRKAARDQAIADKAGKETLREQAVANARSERERDDANKVLSALVGVPKTMRDLREAAGLRSDRVGRAVHILVHDWNVAELIRIEKPCNKGMRTVDAYRLRDTGTHWDTPGQHRQFRVSDTGNRTPGQQGALPP